MSLPRHSIGTKIFGAFIAMGALIAILGAYGYGILSSAGDMAVTTFDGPLMAINYARAAQLDFVQLRLAEQRLAVAQPAARAGFVAQIADLKSTFVGDLAVAQQRSLEPDEQKLIHQISPLIQDWWTARARGDTKTLQKLDDQIANKFDLLIELNTDHSFVGRRHAVMEVNYYKYVSLAVTAAALLLAGFVTMFLSRRIVRPLWAAAAVADRIAHGELQTAIPTGGRDETGMLLRSMTVMQDNIRQRVARETDLRRSAENRLADALETSQEGVILVGADGRIVLANSSLRMFFPRIAGALIGGAAFSDIQALIQDQLSPRETGHIATTGQSELELADGRWLGFTASKTSEGGAIIFLSDFTLIKEREESLRRATRDAEAANAAKTRFLANMSHELRTPLNAIIGFSEIITSQLFGPVGTARYLDYSGDILRSGRHLLDVINSVLDLSKSEAGKMSLDVAAVDLRDVLNDCVAMMREQVADAGLTLSLSGLEASLPLGGDLAKLRQIFLNILSNAVKFTPRGGAVALRVRPAAETIAVIVDDSGIGMSPEDLEVALQPFGQVDNRLERRYEGTGLGLPLTKAFVELHGAVLKIDSVPGTGTRVTVTFPRPMSDLAQAV